VFGFAQYDEFGCISLENAVEALSIGNSNCLADWSVNGI
jgi:hypothetical protein